MKERTFLRMIFKRSSSDQNKAFRSNSAVSKMTALMLAHATPLDMLNGQKIDAGKSLAWSNAEEYHHFFRKATFAL